MTTAYTSLLGLALPVTGELSGTWGDTVNNSITSLLDSAIAGTQTITATTTLTTTTGSANQSRQAILLCSPASANITITAPAQSKIYTVINTSAVYTVKICGVGPTTGVTLAVSESAVVAWNGTDFIRISSNSATTGNFTVNGNLVVTGNTTLGDADTDTITQTASYVTGTQLKSAKTATNTLNLAAYDTDGAAYTNLVTLTASTTPTLALTSTGVGTINNMSIGATTASTGAFTTLSSTGNTTIGDADTDTITQAASYVTGTQLKSAKTATNTLSLAAYDVDGTAYTNLITLTASNTPTLALTSTGVGTINNMSIGATTASTGAFTTLTTSSTVTLNGGTANGVAYLNGSKVLTTGSALTFDGSKLTLLSSGEQLKLESTGDFSSTGQGYLRFYDSGGAKGYLGYAGTASRMDLQTGTGINFNLNATGGIAIFSVSNSEQMRLTSTGLGIGTSSPAYKLDMTVTAANNAGMRLYNSTSGTGNGCGISFSVANGFSSTNQHAAIQALSESSGNTSTSLAFYTSGGSNTGNATERARIDSSGNLGLGITPSAWKSGARAFQLGTTGYASLNEQANGSTSLNFNCYESAANTWTYYVTGVAPTRYTQLSGVHSWFTAAAGTAGNTISFTQAMTLNASGQLTVGNTSTAFDSTAYAIVGSGTGDSSLAIYTSNATAGYLQFADGTSGAEEYRGFIKYDHSTNAMSFSTNSTARSEAEMTIDSSGNVGIGTTSPTYRLDVAQAGATTISSTFAMARITGANATANDLTLIGPNTSQVRINFGDTDAANIGEVGYDHAANSMRFVTNSIARMTIDSSGNLLVGTTTAYGTNSRFSLFVANNTSHGMTFRPEANSGYRAVNFNNSAGSSNVGFIDCSTSATTYSTSSDYRLKHDIQPMTGALAKVAALKPVTYKWNADNSESQGFIAHELQAVVPECVVGEKDAVDAEGNPVYQGIDTSFLVATLTAAIQELKAIVDAQAVEIAALKGTA
jgi:hypothetical protein